MAQPGVWGEVGLDSYIRDRHGEVWRVVGEQSGWLRIRNRAGVEDSMVRPSVDAPITIMVASLEEATATIARHLGGVIIYQEA